MNILICLLLLAQTPPNPTPSDARRITLGPGLMTYTKIAEGLTTARYSTELASRLKNRAALIHLKSRTWDDVKSIFAEGLDLQLRERKDAPGQYVLEPIPAVEEREARWLRKIIASQRNRMDKDFRERRKYLHMPYEEVQRLEQRMAEQHTNDREPAQSDRAAWQAYEDYNHRHGLRLGHVEGDSAHYVLEMGLDAAAGATACPGLPYTYLPGIQVD